MINNNFRITLLDSILLSLRGTIDFNHSNMKLKFVSLLLLISTFSFSQSNEIKLKFIGNAGLHLTDGGLNIYVDFPYKSGAFNYMEYGKEELDNIKDSSIFVFTHRHPDHYNKKLVNAQNGKILGPWKVPKKRRLNLEDLNKTAPEFSIESFETKHRFASRHSSYLIEWHSKRIFISGDTENAEILEKIKKLDWAIIPHWFNADASDKSLKIDAKKRLIYHLYPNQKISGEIPEDVELLNKQGVVYILK